MRAGALLASLLAIALGLASPASASHPAGLPSGAQGLLPPPEPISPPTVTGTLRAGAALTGHDGTWEMDPAFTRQWLRCDAAGANCTFLHDTDLSYVLGTPDVGKRIRLRVLATIVSGSREVDTAPTGIVSAAPGSPLLPLPPGGERPSVLADPTVDGELREGEIVLASPGIWLGSEPMRFANRWDRCDAKRCVPTGEVRFLKKLGKADVGKRMRARVTASNSAGSRAALTAQSPVVQPRTVRYARLKPFPIIGIKGVITGGGVRLRRLAVRAPRGSGLRVDCRGEGCPYRTVSARMRTDLFLVRKLLDRTLETGTTIELRVTRRNRIGKYTRFRILRGRKPERVDRCLVPGASRPSRCAVAP